MLIKERPDPQLSAALDKQANIDRYRLGQALGQSLLFALVLIWMFVMQRIGDWPLSAVSIRTTDPWGWLGLVSAPLFHVSYEHLLSNMFPIVLMLAMLRYSYRRTWLAAFAFIWIAGGFGTWLIGRPEWHLGASGLVSGLWVYLFLGGFYRRDRAAAALSMVVAFLYGSVAWSIFPDYVAAGISWEGHLAGALAGLMAGVFGWRLEPVASRVRYSWEESGRSEDEQGDDDLGGDENLPEPEVDGVAPPPRPLSRPSWNGWG